MKIFLQLSLCFFMYPPLFSQPANDNCSDAITVSAGEEISFSTIGSTTDGPVHATDSAPCFSTSPNDTLFSDIWYSFTPAFTGIVEWSMCGTADFDTKIAVYQAGSPCPPNASDLVACSDDDPECSFATSKVLFAVDIGETYLLRLGGWGLTAPGETGSGTFIIEEFIGAVPNDYCIQAAELSFGFDQPFSNEGATTDGPVHASNGACFGFYDPDVQADIWYSFTALSTSTVEWSTCEMTAPFDTRLAVYKAGVKCTPNDTDLLVCNDDGAGCSDYTSRLVFDVVEGNTYLMRMGGFNGETGSGTFDFFETTPIFPPANDLCVDAANAWISTPEQLENMDNPILGTTIDATFEYADFQFPNAQCFDGNANGEFATVWYWFNTLGNSKLDFNFFKNLDHEGAAFYIDLFDACGSPIDTNVIFGSCLHIDSTMAEAKTTVSGLPDEPTDYLLRVATYLTFNLPGDFSLFIVGNGPTNTKENFPAQINFYPNPVSQQLTVNLDMHENLETNVKIVNSLGQTVYYLPKRHLRAGLHQFEYDVAHLSSGLYYLTLESSETTVVFRFVKT